MIRTVHTQRSKCLSSKSAAQLQWSHLKNRILSGEFGNYRSPLRLADGKRVNSATEWKQRRKVLLEQWHRRLGAWPPLVEEPVMKHRETVRRERFT